MFAFIRKHQYALFVIVAIIGIAFFVFPDSRARVGPAAAQRPLNVLGTRIPGDEVIEIKRSEEILQSLINRKGGQTNMFSDPMFQHYMRITSVAARTEILNDADDVLLNDFVINTALVRVLAKQLGISASQAEIEKRLQSLPIFQVDGKFSPSTWKQYIEIFGGEAGARRKAIYSAIADVILFDKLAALIGEKIPASSIAVDHAYTSLHEQITASVITFEKKDIEEPAVTEEELKEWYERNQGDPALKTEEKRGLIYVLIPRPNIEELNKLSETERAEKERTYKKLAATFSERLVAEDRAGATFEQIATELKLEVKKLDPFPRSTPPEELKTKFSFVRMVFGLPSAGSSDLIETPDGYYIAEVTEIQEPTLLSFEDAKETITNKLKEEKRDKAFTEHVKNTRQKIEEGLKAGKSLAEAAKEAGAPEPRELPVFSQRKRLSEPAAFEIQQAASKTDIGALSEPVKPHLGDTSLLVYVAKKELPKDPKMDDEKKILAGQQALSASQQPTANPIFMAWFNKKRDEAEAGLNKR